MNTRRSICTALMTIVLGVGLAQAGGISQRVGLFATYQDTEDMEDGYGAGLKYVILFQDVAPRLDCGIDVRTSWLTYDSDDNDFRADLDIIPVELLAVAGYKVADGTRLYTGAGAGYYFFDSDEIELDDDIGLVAMLGCDQRVTDMLSLFAEAKYLWLEPDVETSGAAADMDIGGIGANVGVALNW